MLVITNAQRRIFQDSGWERFASEMVEHMRAFAPAHCRVIGEPNVRRVVDLGIAKGKGFGFTYRGPLRFTLELMFLFGSQFDSDPQFPAWAGALLRRGDADDQMYRAELIYRGLEDFYQRVVGPNRQHVLRALERTLELCRSPLPFPEQEIEPGLLRAMEQLYPEKFAYLGAAAHRALIRQGLLAADRHQLDTTRGRTTLCLAMSMMGHAVVGDALYPWFDVPLRDNVSPTKRGPRLERRVAIYLDRTIRNIRGAHGQRRI